MCQGREPLLPITIKHDVPSLSTNLGLSNANGFKKNDWEEMGQPSNCRRGFA